MILYGNLNSKKVLINESQLNILKEALSDNVYHYTSLNSALKIVNSDTIFLQSALGGSADNTNRKELYYMSFTRQKNVNFGYAYKFRTDGVRIEFDGQKLSQKFKGKAIDYWGSSMGKMSYYTDARKNDSFDSKAHHTSNESEDRLFSNEPALYDAHKYIKRIDVIFDPTKENQYQYVYHMLMSRLGRWIFVYDNENDFNKQSDNTLNKKIIDDYENYDKYYDTKPNDKIGRKTYDNVVGKVLQLIFAGEFHNDEVGRESAKLLKQYGLEKYMNGALITRINNGYYNIKDLMNDVSNEISGLSRQPNEESHKVVKLLTDYFKKHGFRNYRDLYKYKVTLGAVNDYDADNAIDLDLRKEFLTYIGTGFKQILIPDPKNTSFWDIIKDKEVFLDNLYNFARNNHSSKDDESFYKYIQHLTKNNISVIQMINIVNRLGLNGDEKKMLFDYGTFQYEYLKYYEAKYYTLPQFDNDNTIKSDKRQNQSLIRKYYLKK